MSKIVKSLLVIGCVALSFLIFQTVNSELSFAKKKQERYVKVIHRLMQIKEAQVLYKEKNGQYTDDMDSLIAFLDSDEFFHITKRDSLGVVVDTIGKISIKDSIIGKKQDVKQLGRIDLGTKYKKNIKLETAFSDSATKAKNFFKASIGVEEVLTGLKSSLIEKELVSGKDILDEVISVGSLREASTDGNWSKELERKALLFAEK